MDKLVLIDTGGFPLKLDDFLWENGQLDASNYGLYEALQAQLLAYGTDYIVEGCTYAAPNITAGWIMLAGELVRVSAHAGTDNFFAKVVTFDARGDKTFKDTSVNSTYQVNRGVLNAASGSLNITTALRLEDKMIQLLATSAQEFAVANIPDLPASKITSGVLDPAQLPPATTDDIGAVERALQSEVDAGVDSGRMVSPANLRGTVFVPAQLPPATTDDIGAVERALQSEVDAGTDSGRMVSPANLRGTVFVPAQLPPATTAAIGAVELALQSEVNTGTDSEKMVTPANLRGTIFVPAQLPQATESAIGAAEIATTAEAIALTNDTKMITPAKLAGVNGGLLTKMIDIGDWDMDATIFVDIAHGLTLANIREVKVSIRGDDTAGNNVYDILVAGSASAGTTNITITRANAGFFDGTDFDQTTFNRGWIIIKYVP